MSILLHGFRASSDALRSFTNEKNTNERAFISRQMTGQLKFIKPFKKFYEIVLDKFERFADKNKIPLYTEAPKNAYASVFHEYDKTNRNCQDFVDKFFYSTIFTPEIFESFQELTPEEQKSTLEITPYLKEKGYLEPNDSPCNVHTTDKNIGQRLTKTFGISVNDEENYKLVVADCLLLMIRNNYDKFVAILQQQLPGQGGKIKSRKTKKMRKTRKSRKMRKTRKSSKK